MAARSPFDEPRSGLFRPVMPRFAGGFVSDGLRTSSDDVCSSIIAHFQHNYAGQNVKELMKNGAGIRVAGSHPFP